MADLIRNSKETWVDADDFGKSFDPNRTFRLADPEAHIRRLSSFTAGMGNVASTHPVFSSKTMYISPTRGGLHVPSNRVQVDEHDEGLIHTSGHLQESATAALRLGYKNVDDYINRLRSGNVDTDYSSASTHLHSTRMPYSHHVDIIPGEPGWRNEHDGSTEKLIADENDEDFGFTREGARWQVFGDDTQSNNFREAMGDLRHRVRGVLRDPSSPRARQIMEHALANPVHQPRLRGYEPERFSPQFLKIIQQSRRGHDAAEDVIDLKTGTWANIHPDEYFPTGD